MHKRIEFGAWIGFGGWVCGLLLMQEFNFWGAAIALVFVTLLPLMMRHSPYAALVIIGGQAFTYGIVLVLVKDAHTWLTIAPLAALVISNNLYIQGYHNEWALLVLWIPLSQMINPALSLTIDFLGPVVLCAGIVVLYRQRPFPVAPLQTISTPTTKTTAEHVGVWFSRLDEAAQNLNANAGTVQTVISQQSARIAQQSSALQSLRDSLSELGNQHHRAYQAAQELSAATSRNQAQAETALTSIQHSEHYLAQADGALQAVGLGLGRLALHMRRIGQVITLMNDLSTQANFLAMNAQIEAARASEHGQGFVIVADEVRDLATRSRLATKTMKDLVQEIQQAMLHVVDIAEASDGTLKASMKASNEGTHLVTQVHESATSHVIAVQALATALEQYREGLSQLKLILNELQQLSTQDQTAAHMVNHLTQTIGQLTGNLLMIIAEENP